MARQVVTVASQDENRVDLPVRAPEVRSAELYRRACDVLPGGVNSPVRSMQAIGRDPLFVAGGEGAYIDDADGSRYVDWVCSWGPLVAGHARGEVVRAMQTAAAQGASFGAPTGAEVELAEEIRARVPSAEMVRMTCSGTEAAMSAVRLARAATGRDAIIKFAGAYHGHSDGLMAEAGSGLATHGIPASPGVTRAQAADTVVIAWNDRAAVAEALAERPVAAIVCEPYPANMGLVPPDPRFLRFLREQADRAAALLIFDEVISGFRVARGGAQEREGVIPDLTIMGKIVGGGLPAGAYAGRRSLMGLIAPAGPVYQAGTLAGNPVAVAAGLATLRLLDEDAYQHLDAITQMLADGLEAAARRAGIPVQVPHTTGLLTLFFSDHPVRDLDGARRADAARYAQFCRSMLRRGVYLPASPFEAWFPSLAHTQDHVRVTLAAAEETFGQL
jgi:glutamate-1-semialdehyde 2,1-aminomutase